MDHPLNKGNVLFEDYYPAAWIAMAEACPGLGDSMVGATRRAR